MCGRNLKRKPPGSSHVNACKPTGDRSDEGQPQTSTKRSARHPGRRFAKQGVVEQGVVEQRASAADWSAINAALDANGFAVIFAGHQRPVRGVRGSYCVNLRHGVSAVRSGNRYTLGIIFHDAK